MPGSLLNVGRKVTRHDSTRSDISTYSNDSKKKVSFNKAVRVKKYTRSEDGGQKDHNGKKFWFKVHKSVDPDFDPDRWEEYSGDEDKYSDQNRLKTIDESSGFYQKEDHKNNIQDIINKFNEQSLNKEENGASGDYDTLTKCKRNSILNGMKAFFGSTSLRNKKKNNSVRERNLENLFKSDYTNYNTNGDVSVDTISEEKWALKPDRQLNSKDNKVELSNDQKQKPFMEIDKWESGDQLIFDEKQYDKTVNKTDEGQLSKTVEQRDQVWKNISRTITYAESSPKVIKKNIESTFQAHKDQPSNYQRPKKAASASNPTKNQRSGYTSDSKIRNADKYKVIRSKNGIVSAYSNVPLLEEDVYKVNKQRTALSNIERPAVCTKNHGVDASNKTKTNIGKREIGSKVLKKDISYESPIRKRDATTSTSNTDYRRGYATLSTGRRIGRNRTKSYDNYIPNVSGIKILVNGEDIEENAMRGGLAAAYKSRLGGRNLSASPLRHSRTSGSGSDSESTHQHKAVVLYIPGISHQQRKADSDDKGAVTRSQSMIGKRPTKYHQYGSNNRLHKEPNLDENDELLDDRHVISNRRWVDYGRK